MWTFLQLNCKIDRTCTSWSVGVALTLTSSFILYWLVLHQIMSNCNGISSLRAKWMWQLISEIMNITSILIFFTSYFITVIFPEIFFWFFSPNDLWVACITETHAWIGFLCVLTVEIISCFCSNTSQIERLRRVRGQGRGTWEQAVKGAAEWGEESWMDEKKESMDKRRRRRRTVVGRERFKKNEEWQQEPINGRFSVTCDRWRVVLLGVPAGNRWAGWSSRWWMSCQIREEGCWSEWRDGSGKEGRKDQLWCRQWFIHLSQLASCLLQNGC